MARLDAFLQLGREQGCSDVHLAVGMPPLRMHGELMPVKYRNLGDEELQALVDEILTETQRVAFAAGNDVDFSYAGESVGRFRANLFRKLGGIGASFRVIPSEIPSLDSLGLPPVVKNLTHHHQGLVLVTGAAGTGKSTTLAAMIDHLNSTRRLNIITLEDPIEFVHPQQDEPGRAAGGRDPCRELRRGSPGGASRRSRHHPGGGMRDTETITLAMIAAETGHLVLGTLAHHQRDQNAGPHPRRTAHRAAGPGDRVSSPRACAGIVSQTLVRTADGRGRRAIGRILVMTPAIANLLASGKAFQIPSTLANR